MKITQMLITSNNKGKKGANHPRFIVIHDTGNSNTGSDADNHARWLENTPNTGRSAHLFVDDKQIVQVIEYDTPAWHTGKLYVSKPQVPECTNFNSIGIEFCINADGNLEKTLFNTVQIITHLMLQFNIPLGNVITHQMSSGKACPGTFIKNPSLYNRLIEQIEEALKPDEEVQEALSYLEKEGVMNTPEYWLNQIKTQPYLRALILNFYKALKQAKEGK